MNEPLTLDCNLWYTDRSIEDTLADPHTIEDDFKGKRVIFLATGLGQGSNISPTKSSVSTENYIKQFQELQQYDEFKDITLVVMDMDDTRDKFAETFNPYASDTIKVISPGDDYMLYDAVWYASWVDYVYSTLDPDYALEGSHVFAGFDELETAWAFKERVTRPVA